MQRSLGTLADAEAQCCLDSKEFQNPEVDNAPGSLIHDALASYTNV